MECKMQGIENPFRHSPSMAIRTVLIHCGGICSKLGRHFRSPLNKNVIGFIFFSGLTPNARGTSHF